MRLTLVTTSAALALAIIASQPSASAQARRDPPGVVTFDPDTVIRPDAARFKDLAAKYDLADVRLTEYLQQSMLTIQQGHRTGYDHFRVWFREIRDAQKRASVGVAQAIIKYAFPKIADAILPGSGAVAKEVQSILATVGTVDKLLTMPEGNVELFLDRLGAAEQVKIEKLLDFPKQFRNNPQFNAAKLEYLEVRLQNPVTDDRSKPIPESVVEMLDAMGIPQPGAATARTVAEEVLAAHILTVMQKDAEWRDQWPYSETEYAKAHALRVLDKEGNKKRICEVTRSWSYYWIIDKKECAPLLRR